jgi:hypothetical protein
LRTVVRTIWVSKALISASTIASAGVIEKLIGSSARAAPGASGRSAVR